MLLVDTREPLLRPSAPHFAYLKSIFEDAGVPWQRRPLAVGDFAFVRRATPLATLSQIADGAPAADDEEMVHVLVERKTGADLRCSLEDRRFEVRRAEENRT